MRIRRMASKILGTASVLQSFPSPVKSLLTPPPASQLEEAAVCVLNQSLWDLLSSPPASPASHLKVEGGEFVERDGTALKSMSAKKGKENFRMEEENEMEDSSAAAVAPVIFKKTDRKRSKCKRCKRPVSQPHLFCHQHLPQLQSCNYADNNMSNIKALVTARKKRAVSFGSDSNSFYYYSPFGPWRGKRRGGGQVKVAVEEAPENKKVESDVRVEDEIAEEVDSMEDTSDEDNWVERNQPRRRKPVKERSLKSLL